MSARLRLVGPDWAPTQADTRHEMRELAEGYLAMHLATLRFPRGLSDIGQSYSTNRLATAKGIASPEVVRRFEDEADAIMKQRW